VHHCGTIKSALKYYGWKEIWNLRGINRALKQCGKKKEVMADHAMK
jgi:hypothetical protein